MAIRAEALQVVQTRHVTFLHLADASSAVVDLDTRCADFRAKGFDGIEPTPLAAERAVLPDEAPLFGLSEAGRALTPEVECESWPAFNPDPVLLGERGGVVLTQ